MLGLWLTAENPGPVLSTTKMIACFKIFPAESLAKTVNVWLSSLKLVFEIVMLSVQLRIVPENERLVWLWIRLPEELVMLNIEEERLSLS